MIVKIVKYIVFYVYHRFYSLRPPVAVVPTVLTDRGNTSIVHQPRVILITTRVLFSWKLGFPRKKNPLQNEPYTRVGCLVLSFSVMCACGCRHGSTVFRLRLSTALNAHGTNFSPGGNSARTHEIISFWYGVSSFTVSSWSSYWRCGNVCRPVALPWVKKTGPTTVEYQSIT